MYWIPAQGRDNIQHWREDMIPTPAQSATSCRIVEAEGPEFEIGFLLPDATPETIAYRDWMEPDSLEPGTNKLIMALIYVLKTSHHTILIDSCRQSQGTSLLSPVVRP